MPLPFFILLRFSIRFTENPINPAIENNNPLNIHCGPASFPSVVASKAIIVAKMEIAAAIIFAGKSDDCISVSPASSSC